MGDTLWKLSTFHIVFIQSNLLDRPDVKFVKFGLFSCFVFYYQNKIMICFFTKKHEHII